MEKNNKERSKSLEAEPIVSLLVKHSIPAIVGMLVNLLYNIVDRIFIGRGVGGVAIGAIYLGMPLMLIIMAFGMLVGIGGNTLVSIRLGQDRQDEANQIASNSLMLLTIIGVIFTILGLIFLEPILKYLVPVVSALWVLYYFYSKKSVLSIQRKYLKIKSSKIR